MSYNVQFVGLSFFNWQTDGNMRVLLPDGRAVPNVQPHKFSISVPPGSVAVDPTTTGWTAGKNVGQFDEDQFQTQFWFPPSKIDLPGTELGPNDPHPTLIAANQIPRLPSLRATDPNAKIEPDNPQTKKVADLTMAKGTVEAFKIPGGNPKSCAIISQLTVDHDDATNITITLTEIADPENAATSNPGTVRTIVLKPQTEIAIVNTSRGAGKAAAEKSHYSIYEQLTYAPCVLVAPQIPPMKVPASTSQHPFFTAPDAAVTGPGCSNATI